MKKTVTQKHKADPITDIAEMSPETPIPFEGGRGFSYVADAPYLPFLSTDDNYARLLLETRLLSATHNACIVTKKDYCAGSGFRHSDGTEMSQQLTDWLKSINLRDESGLEINQQIFEGDFTFGNCPIEIVRLTVMGRKHLFVYVHDLMEWRLGQPDDNDICQYAVHSKLFLRNQALMTVADFNKSRRLPLYNVRNKDKSGGKIPKDGYNWITDENGAERTLIWYRNALTGFPHYGLPSAIAGLIYEKLEYKAGRHNLDNFDNNMVVSAILALKGSLSQTEANKIGKRIIQNHTGDGKRGRVAVVASEEGIAGSDFHNMDTHREGSYKDADLIWSEKIILANQWDAVLAGIMSPTSLGKGAAFITKILEIKKNTVIRPAQFRLGDKVWSRIFKIAKDWLKIPDNIATLEIADRIDISGLTDVDITPAVTVNEVRQAKGMTDLKDKKKGEMLLGELGNEQKKGVYVKQTKNVQP